MTYQPKVRWHNDEDMSRPWPRIGGQVATREDAEKVVTEHFTEKGPPQTTHITLDWNVERTAAFARWPMSSRTEDDPEPYGYVYYVIEEVPAPRTIPVQRRKGRL